MKVFAILDGGVTVSLRVFCALVIYRCYGDMHYNWQDRWGN